MDKTKFYLDLSKCTEEEQKYIFSLLPEPIKKGDYQIDSENYFLHFNNGFSYPRWYVDFEYYNKTELTYPEFIKLFEGGESKEVLQVENNGWIKIESEDNIPKHFGYYWIKLSVDALDEIVCYNAVHKEGFAGVDNQFYAYNIIGYYAPIKKPKF